MVNIFPKESIAISIRFWNCVFGLPSFVVAESIVFSLMFKKSLTGSNCKSKF